MKKIMLAVLLGAFATTDYAAPAQTAFGLELGAVNALVECPIHPSTAPRPTKWYEAIPEYSCVEDAHPLNGYKVPVRTFVFGRSEQPPIVKNWRMFLLEDGGRLIGIHFITAGVSTQDLVLATLTEKFGKPTALSRRSVSNLQGAVFDAVSAAWLGDQVVVRFEGIDGKLTSGEVFIDLPEGAALRRSWSNQDRAGERKL